MIAKNEVLEKIENILNDNYKKFKLNNINLLIIKDILKNLDLLEFDNTNKNLIIQKSNYLLSNKILEENTIYTKNRFLTKLSSEIVTNVYRVHGFKFISNHEIIKEYYLKNNLNYNLFFNQVDRENDILVDYFKIIENENCNLII